MTETPLGIPQRVMAFSAILEVGTGLALIVSPAAVVGLLATPEDAGADRTLARLAGIALLALGMSCLPHNRGSDSHLSAGMRGMMAYNTLVTLYLAYLGAIGSWYGVLLWPAAAVHAVIALFLIWTWCVGWRKERHGS